jgi:hypothetical protein
VNDVTTTSQALDNPTPPGQLTQRQPEPTRHDGSQPRGVIADAQYERLSPDEQSKFARVKRGLDGGSQWQDRSTLQSSTDPTAKPAAGSATTSPALVPEVK